MICFILYLRAISKNKSLGAYIRRGDLMEEFFALRVWGAYICRGLCMKGLFFWNFDSWACRQGFFCVQLHAEQVNTYLFIKLRLLHELLGSLRNHDDDGNKNLTNLHIWRWKTIVLHALHVHFSCFDILKTFSFFLRREMTCFARVWTTWA